MTVMNSALHLSDRQEPVLTMHNLSSRYVLEFFGQSRAMTLLKHAGILQPSGTLPDEISKADYWQMCLDSINLYDDEGHGCLTRPLPKSSWAMVFSAVNQMETLGDGLKRIAELLPVLQCGVRASVGYCSKYAHLTFKSEDHIQPTNRSERYLDLIGTCFLCILLWGAEREFQPERMRVSSVLNPNDGYMLAGLSRQKFDRFGTGATISFRHEDLTIKLGTRRYQYWGTHETSVFRRLYSNLVYANSFDRDDITDDVCRLISGGTYSQGDIARKLGISVATLQRRLQMCGTSFRQLSRDVRSEQLASLLATSGDLEDIASEIGFSDRRSLTRACSDWFGMTPSKFRDTYRKAQEDLTTS